MKINIISLIWFWPGLIWCVCMLAGVRAHKQELLCWSIYLFIYLFIYFIDIPKSIVGVFIVSYEIEKCVMEIMVSIEPNGENSMLTTPILWCHIILGRSIITSMTKYYIIGSTAKFNFGTLDSALRLKLEGKFATGPRSKFKNFYFLSIDKK